MIKFIKAIKQVIEDLYKTIAQLSINTLDINDRLRNIEKVMPKDTFSVATTGLAGVSYVDSIENGIINLLNDTLIKDYFTKEFLNKEAITTKELYVVDGNKITIQYYNINYNKHKRIEEINGHFYYFNS